MPVRVTWTRLPELPDGGLVSYWEADGHVLILIRDDLVTEEGAQAICNLQEEILNTRWQPVRDVRLSLVQGGRMPESRDRLPS
jgi:hypothetical protein